MAVPNSEIIKAYRQLRRDLSEMGLFDISSAQLVALGVIAVLTWLNVTGLRTGASVQNLFTLAQLGALLALVAMAVVTARGRLANFQPLLGVDLGPDLVGDRIVFTPDAGYTGSPAPVTYRVADARGTVVSSTFAGN